MRRVVAKSLARKVVNYILGETMHPCWSNRIWDMYLCADYATHRPTEWVGIAFLRYWTTTEKWYGY